jgi:hypothetical protein
MLDGGTWAGQATEPASTLDGRNDHIRDFVVHISM